MSLAVLSLLVVLSIVQAAPSPDFSVQPGDEGAYHGEGHHHDHHHEHEDHDLEIPEPPPPPSLDQKKKDCKLVYSPKPIQNGLKSPMCFNEPECSTECNQVPQRECTPITQQKCEEYNVTACNVVQEEVCETNYVTQYENQCETQFKEQCRTRYVYWMSQREFNAKN